jgi:hypothetical protein
MPNSIPNPPTPLTIQQIAEIGYADARAHEVPLEIWQSLPTFIRKPEIADYPLIAYSYHVTFKRPVGYQASEPMWVNYIDPFTGALVVSSHPDRPFFPDDPTVGVFLGLKFEGTAIQNSADKPIYRPIDEPVWQAGFNRLLNDPVFLSDPDFFFKIPDQPKAEDVALAFAFWRQCDTLRASRGFNDRMWIWMHEILYYHEPRFPSVVTDPATGKPLERGLPLLPKQPSKT